MTRYLAIVFAALLIGCAPSLVDARAAVDAAARVYERVEPALGKQRALDGNACFDAGGGAPVVETCLDGVRSRWASVRHASETAYRLLIAAEGVVGTAEAAARVGRLPSLPHVMAVVMAALDAAGALQAALLEMSKAQR